MKHPVSTSPTDETIQAMPGVHRIRSGETISVHMSDRRSHEEKMPPQRIIAISSGGGHWIQLLRLMPLFDQHETTFVTVSRAYQEYIPDKRLHVVRDATRWDKFGLIVQLLQITILVMRYRPHVIVSTGAAPGYFAIRLGKLLGARTIWLDSIANSEKLSGSGTRIGKYADLWLTQWEHLAQEDGPTYGGNVL